MSSSQNPLFLIDTTEYIFAELSLGDLNNSRLVCRNWHNDINGLHLVEKKKLQTEFNVPMSVVATLQSPHLVWQRLARIIKRGKIPHLPENKLYRMYCASGNFSEDFLHLLDTDEQWFEKYFAARDTFFLAYHLRHACIMGHLPLIKFLEEKKNCTLSGLHLSLAVASADLPAAEYLLTKRACVPKREHTKNLYKHAFFSGSVEMLNFLAQRYGRQMVFADFVHAIKGGSVEMVKMMRETYNFPLKDIPVTAVRKSRSTVLKYLVGECGWVPEDRDISYGTRVIYGADQLYLAACGMGQPNALAFVESMFALPMSSPEFVRAAFQAAAIPGDLACLRHLKMLDLDPDHHLTDLLSGGDQQWILERVCESGDVASLEFLFLECAFSTTNGESLYKKAAGSGNLVIVDYIRCKVGADFSNAVFLAACRSENLELISELYQYAMNLAFINESEDEVLRKSYVMNLTADEIRKLCEISPLSLHYLITMKNFPVRQEMLDCVLALYGALCDIFHLDIKDPAEADDLFQFAKYLIESHHLIPSQEARDEAEVRAAAGVPGASEILTILPRQQDAVVPDRRNSPRGMR